MGYPALLQQSDEDAAEDTSDTIGGRLVRARETTGLSASQLARRIGVKTKTLRNWEMDRTAPRSNRLTILAGILNVSPTWILVGRGEAPSEDDVSGAVESRQGLLYLRQSIQTKIEELKQIVEEVDGMLDRRPGL